MIPTLLALVLAADAPTSTVTILAFSDYHSHATPFYSEGRHGQAGIARAIAYMKAARARPGTLVISGGDTVNKGSPTWSDEYRGVEWPWLNGIVDVSALGNHDLDYGWAEFERGRATAQYPFLLANLVGEDGAPLLLSEGKPYLVREVAGVRIGLFALAGPDVQRLIRKEDLPPGATWRESIAVAREIVTTLREKEKVGAVVFIGHEQREEDETMAQEVEGIDLVLGTHAHHKGEWATIEGTRTGYIAPYQYLTYISEVELQFGEGKLKAMRGRLVRMDESMPEDPEVRSQVAQLQSELERRHPERFSVLGQAEVELSDEHVSTGESVIGNWATEVLRQAAQAQVFMTTSSGFRAGIPPGPVTGETFYSAIPYKNRVVTADMTGAQLQELLAACLRASGSGGFCQQSGIRYKVAGGRPTAVQVLTDPILKAEGYAPLRPLITYRIATSDYQAYVASGYKDLFAAARNLTKTEIDAHEALLAALKAGPVRAALDGRGPS